MADYARDVRRTDLHALPGGSTVRPATDADLEAIVRLIDDADTALGLDPDAVREFLTWIWHIPSTDLARDTRLVSLGSEFACFAQGMWSPEEGGPLNSLVRVHPGQAGKGIGTAALAWVEALAAERGSEGVRAQAVDRDAAGHALLESRGYVQVRSSWTMGRKLGPVEDPGATPPGVTIRAFQAGRDERALHRVHEASFADHWGYRPSPFETFQAEMYEAEDWDPSLAHVAEVDGAIVGHVVALSFEGEGHVALLGVVPGSRGRGIARALLRRAFTELAKRGHREVRLTVDAQNPTGAVALYEGVGMTAYRAYDIFDLGTPEATTPSSRSRANRDRGRTASVKPEPMSLSGRIGPS
jgi:mycothiol synthase